MSACISRHGEFSSHDLDALHACTLCGVLDEDALRAELATVTGERDRFREHSITLNTIAFRIAEALGDVPQGQDWTEGNPIEQADRIIGELANLRVGVGRLRALFDDQTKVVRVEPGNALLIAGITGFGPEALTDALARLKELTGAAQVWALEDDVNVLELDGQISAQLANVKTEFDELRAQLATVTGERDDALLVLADLTPAQRDRERAVLDAAVEVVKVWRRWATGQGKDPIPIKALANAVDVMALGPAVDALAESTSDTCVCPRTPHDYNGTTVYHLDADADCPMHGETTQARPS